MSLCHEFAIIEKDNSENFIDANMNAVSISDEIILYIKDSLYWIDTWWNGKEKKKGLSYYGYTKIEDKNIGKLICILDAWIALFKMAPEKFVLTGNYLLEEDKYEENPFTKKELLQQLKSLKTICIDAVNQNMDILHNGI